MMRLIIFYLQRIRLSGVSGENPEGGKSPLEAYELSVETLQKFY